MGKTFNTDDSRIAFGNQNWKQSQIGKPSAI